MTSRLILGTAQFGLAYGITNRRGQIGTAEARDILMAACAAGVTAVDTAPGYGTSEEVLGACTADFPDLSIITKTPAFSGPEIEVADADRLRRSIEHSLVQLKRPKVAALLIHHGRDLLKPGGERLVAALQAVKSSGHAERIGVSIYDAAEIDAALARFVPDIVQLPMNVFDQRLIRSGHIARLRTAGIEIHARSPFLQGVLLASQSDFQRHFPAYSACFERFAAVLGQSALAPIEACLGFALRQSGADRIVVGVTGIAEIRELLAAIATLPMDLPDVSGLAVADTALVDPRQWPANRQ